MTPDDDNTRDGPPPTSSDGLGEAAGDFIGPYRLLEIIGEGGFGVVWLAEKRGEVVFRVALKVIKPGMDSKSVIERFEAERRILALMDHPNIARIIDAGTTPARMGSRPYFVMDYVPGDAITDYCDRRRLTIRQRLDLFITVCGAVQHAHAKGVIHRDLKPTNILVAEVQGANPAGGVEGAVPKIIDFGVAKALGLAMNSATMYTERGVLIGTPEYMSPEQADGDPVIDGRTDVYALGVVLYELLSGALPFDRATLRSAALEEVRRIIREVDPPRPSTKLTGLGLGSQEVARKRHTDRDSLVQELRDELEWVPLRAMRKEREERYATPSDMARDIRAALNDEPLDRKTAPPGPWHRARKFIGRHRGWAIAGAAGAAAAAAWFGASTLIFELTPIDRRFDNLALRLLPYPSLGQSLRDIRIIGLTDKTDTESLARSVGLDGVTAADRQSHRRLYAYLLRRLAGSGCRTIVFDLLLRKESRYDQDLADAARALHEKHNTDTVIAVPSWDLSPDGLPLISPIIAPAVRVGAPTGGFHTDRLWRMDLLARRRGEQAVPSLALAAVASYWAPGTETVLIPGTNEVEVQHLAAPTGPIGTKPQACPANIVGLSSFDSYEPRDASEENSAGLTLDHRVGVALVPIPDDAFFTSATVEYGEACMADDSKLRSLFGGKIVLIANIRAGEDTVQFATGSRAVAGAWTHAATMQALLLNRIVHAPSTRVGRITVTAAALTGALAGWRYSRNLFALSVALGFGLAFAICASGFSYSALGILWNPLLEGAAFVIGVGLAAILGRIGISPPLTRARSNSGALA